MPKSYQTLASQEGNFPVFEGTSLYSLRLDHNLNNSHRLTVRANVSPSTVTGIEVSGEDQPYLQIPQLVAKQFMDKNPGVQINPFGFDPVSNVPTPT